MAHVLLTGVTGNLGAETLFHLIRQTTHSITVIIRAGSYFEGLERLQQIGLQFGLSERECSERVTVYIGDLRFPHLGLAPQDFRLLCEQTEVIIHSAAALSLKLSFEDACASTLVPAESCIDLAQQCARLSSFILVSTVGVGGTEYESLPEIAPLLTRDFRNTYERVKFLCEQRVLEELTGKVKIAIIRPSMIVGTQAQGRALRPQIFASICQLLVGSLTNGFVPELGAFYLDTIPSDLVARAICALATTPAAEDVLVLHLCSGRERRISFPELESAALEVLGDNTHPNRKIVSLGEFQAALPLLMESGAIADRKRLNVLPFLFDYFTFDQLFENRRTLEFLSPHGISIPAASSYLEHSIRVALQVPRVKKSAKRDEAKAGNE